MSADSAENVEMGKTYFISAISSWTGILHILHLTTADWHISYTAITVKYAGNHSSNRAGHNLRQKRRPAPRPQSILHVRRAVRGVTGWISPSHRPETRSLGGGTRGIIEQAERRQDRMGTEKLLNGTCEG